MSANHKTDLYGSLPEIIRDNWTSYVKRRSESRRQGRLRPSTIVMGCRLVSYYDLTYADALQENRDAEGYMIMDIGTFVHREIQQALATYYASVGALYTPEVRLKFSERCNGITDAVVIFPDDTAEVHEYKTCSKSVFDTIQRTPKEDHIFQLMGYMKQLKITKGRLVYFSRNNSLQKEHIVTYDEVKGNFVSDEIAAIEDAAAKAIPPDPTAHHLGADPCTKVCVYRHLCPLAKRESSRKL